MRGVNQVFILGALGRDPDVRHTRNGKVIANLSVATTDGWRNQETGESNEHTEWHRCVCFGKTAEIAEQYLSKGDKVHVQGKLRTNQWKDKDGNQRYTTEILVNDLQMLGGSQRGGQRRQSTARQQEAAPESADFDDEIPF